LEERDIVQIENSKEHYKLNNSWNIFIWLAKNVSRDVKTGAKLVTYGLAI